MVRSTAAVNTSSRRPLLTATATSAISANAETLSASHAVRAAS